jgi:hypothetical protein
MKTWREEDKPAWGYDCMTPHHFWPGGFHHWGGMEVPGLKVEIDGERKKQNHNKYGEGYFTANEAQTRLIRSHIAKTGFVYKVADLIGMRRNKLSQKLGGHYPFHLDELPLLCEVINMDIKAFLSLGEDN